MLEAQGRMAPQVAYTIELELLSQEDLFVLRTSVHDFDAWGRVVRLQRLAELEHEDALIDVCALAPEAICRAPESAFGHARLSEG